MPKTNKSGGFKPAKNYVPNGSKSGSKSPGHRGYQAAPASGAPKKARWNADERAARSSERPAYSNTERPSYGDRPQRSERPSYGDRPQRSNDRPSYGDRPARTERPSYGDRPQRSERPSYGDRPQRSNDRPSYGDRPQRSNDRPSYGNRPARTERPSYGDRPQRSERPSYGDRPQRSNDRPSYGDRPARTERPSYGDRPQRSNDRPSYGDRPARTERPSYGDRPQRSERSSYGDRPQRNNDRPSYGDRTERPSYGDRPARTERPSYGDRPARTERPSYGDRPARTERPSYGDRPQRSNDRGSDFYPKRDDRPSAGHSPVDDVVLERLEAQATTAVEVEGVSFKDLGLGDNIERQLQSMGALSPFPIQAATIPDVLAGKDVLGRGKTGSGKTIAFGAPVVERLMENGGAKGRKPGRLPRALILAPTRELAMQIDRTVQPIARAVGLNTTTVFGGVPQFKQVSALQRGTDIIIATPGRLEDLVEQGRLDLSKVTITVLDEADHMCDLGFLEPVQRILRLVADGGQRLLFSATLDKGVAQLVNEFLVNPAVHEVAGEDQASSTIDHRVLLIEQRDKREIIQQLASGPGKTLVFARTRAFAEELADQLDDAGIPATSLHGDLNQSRRTRNLQLLTSGRVNVLVATDVAARGIHVDDINLVIQADAPDEYKTYLHRSGRTGRAGKKGMVITLINRSRQRRMDELLGRAEIRANTVNARPGDQLLDDLRSV
ncbi:RNA helicase [Clavibacter michiganensis]|nr:DEAD/DEAH box helicase [Clavibacter michiganensis]PPF62621.1 RNA helicase [Clavibacter michiganensis]